MLPTNPTFTAATMREIQAILHAEADRARAQVEAQQKARIDAADKEKEACAPKAVISDKQLTALQARIETLQVAELITSDEAFLLEDLCADIIELEAEAGQLTAELARTNPTISKASKLIALSQRIPSDAALARQIRRKLLRS